MTEKENQHLEADLSRLTRWEGEPTELWQKALAEAETAKTARKSLLSVFWGSTVLKAAAVVVLLLGVVAVVPMISPGLGGLAFSRESRESVKERVMADRSESPQAAILEAPGLRRQPPGTAVNEYADVTLPVVPPAERNVVRKATIELVTDDVAAVFVKCTQLISEAHGEFIESSSLKGTGAEAKANLKLRVAAGRLGQVLASLRELATVRSEESSGEDVSNQVVDLDARLRNERRIEAELLELLDRRDDAPLRDVLELRRRINEIRGSIERLVAQQAQLESRVERASVLVIIRPEDTTPEEPDPEAGLGEYFSGKIHGSWSGGVRFLTDTMAFWLQLLVGGLLWWLIAVTVLLAARQFFRQARQAKVTPAA
jgi:hypothetical protein